MDHRAWIAANKRMLIAAGAAAVLLGAILLALSATRGWNAGPESEADKARQQAERLQEACASAATYHRLKQVLFEEAIRVRGGNSPNLDLLAANTVVRMEDPVVRSRDTTLNVTVCSGTFVLELPPGAERGFGGERRLTAEIEYAAQEAADGSGLVYQMTGAEPIVYRLATFDFQRERQAQAADGPATGERYAEAPEPPAPPPPEPEPEPKAQPRDSGSASANPSFDCRHAGTRSERMVCASPRLAALDRQMSSLFYSALTDADGRTRRLLRASRDRFLAYRERCGSEACIAQAYRDRMDEIRDIMAGR